MRLTPDSNSLFVPTYKDKVLEGPEREVTHSRCGRGGDTVSVTYGPGRFGVGVLRPLVTTGKDLRRRKL